MTVTAIRTGHLNRYLGVTVDGDTIPWTVADRDAFIVQALTQLYPDVAKRGQGTVALNQNSDVYTIPSNLQAGKVNRIEIEQTTGGTTSRVDRVPNWRYYSDTQVRITPLLASNTSAQLRFFGWIPFLVDGTDIPLRMEPIVAMRAAAFAYGAEASQMGNYKRQQGLDQSRVVDYSTLVGLSAYYERRYFEQISKDPAHTSYSPRAAYR